MLVAPRYIPKAVWKDYFRVNEMNPTDVTAPMTSPKSTPAIKTLHPSSPAVHAIVVAACDNLPESRAMARWILPVLQAWPKASWHVWLTDATNCTGIKAAKIDLADSEPDWKNVDHQPADGEDPVCRIIGGRTGIVIYAHHVIAQEASRGLDGLVAAMTSFPANDPLARPLKKSFASFGVTAGI